MKTGGGDNFSLYFKKKYNEVKKKKKEMLALEEGQGAAIWKD